MVDPFISLLAHVQVIAEGLVIWLPMRRWYNSERWVREKKRRGLAVAFNEVVANIRADKYEQKPQSADRRKLRKIAWRVWHSLRKPSTTLPAHSYWAT